MKTAPPVPYNYQTPDWAPLLRALRLAGLPSPAGAGAFMWMCEEPMGVHQYKHQDTRAYIRLRIDTSPPACIREITEAFRLAQCVAATREVQR